MSKVPFALFTETNEYVDVHDVERGIKCNCICPSCKTPLNARQGSVNAWHFAHATRGTSEKTSNDCEFSFYVSVTQMAKQLFADESQVRLSLPEYLFLVEDRHPLHLCRISKEISITPATDVDLTDIHVESKVSRHPGDVIGSVKSFPLIIALSHKEKSFLPDPDLLDGVRAGVLEIDLNPTLKIFFDQERRGTDTFKVILKEFLFSEIEHKRWLYHPRQDAKIEKAREELIKESLDISAGAAIPRSDISSNEDFIDRALAGFKLNKS